jgi:hypothetical protein
MDLLDRVRPVAEDLLGRVDAALHGFGAPPEHPVWSLMRRVGATPADAFAHVASLAPEPLREAGEALRRTAAGWPALVAALPAAVDSQGIAAQAYADARPAIATDLDALVDGMDATARYVGEVADWMAGARRALAREAATCLGSRQALVLRSYTPGTAGHGVSVAAADLGARILAMIAASLDAGWRVREASAPALAEHNPTARTADLRLHAAHRIDIR